MVVRQVEVEARLEEAHVGSRQSEGGEVHEPRPHEGVQGLEWECGPKHVRRLLREYCMSGCKGKETSMAKESVQTSWLGGLVVGEAARKARMGIASIN